MKKIAQLFLVLCLLVVGTQAAFAHANKAEVAEGADLTAVHRIALGAPLYVQKKDAPSKDELTQAMADASKVSRSYVIPYATMVENIKKDANVDIANLERHQAAKIFKEHAADYADAYVILTVANDSKTVFYFDVYQAGTNKRLYTFTIAKNRSEDESIGTYQTLSEQFYKNFDRSATAQQEGKDKPKKEKKGK